MFYIDTNNSDIKLALKEHSDLVHNYINSNHLKSKTLINKYIKDNLTEIIEGLPSTIKDLNTKFYDNLGTNYSSKEYIQYIEKDLVIHFKKRSRDQRKNVAKYNKLNTKIENIINYEKWFIKAKVKPDYLLAKNLKRNTCTYCNRLYTNTMTTQIGDKKIMRPQFDHWFPKKKYPLLGLSFFNLIPSCSICNSSVKGDTNFNLKTHLHPYVDADSLKSFSFGYDPTTKIDEYEIKIIPINSKSKSIKTFDDMHLKEIYNAHQSELHDLILIEKNYSKSYIDTILASFPKAGLSKPEVYRILFGTEFKEKDFHKRPFSKFKSDILKDLGIIKK